MKLMVFYVAIIIVGAFLAWGIGIAVATYSERFSLPVFLACFFLNFWISWVLAVRLTEPKGNAPV